MPPPPGSFFATCARGLEPVLHAEVRTLRLAKVERQVGGVYFEGTLRDAWRANLWLRTAGRVLMRVARFECAGERELYAGVREIDWSRFLAPRGRLIVDAHSKESRLDHTRFVEQRVKDAVVDQFRERAGSRPSVGREDADLGVYVHLFRDRCTLLVDTSGHSLHKRGWRRDQGRAPLAETLAAGIVQMSGWDARSPLLDPFCGSGTLVVEAALLAARAAPGLFAEGFGFERWRGHDPRGWEREKARAREARARPAKLVLRGSDVDPERIAGARANAQAAGVAELVDFEVLEATRIAPRRGWNAWIVSNLPYGERLGRTADLAALYRSFGALLRERCAGYRVALLCADALRDELGLAAPQVVELENGGLDCRLVRCTLGA